MYGFLNFNNQFLMKSESIINFFHQQKKKMNTKRLEAKSNSVLSIK